MTPNPILADVLELAALYRPSWPEMAQEARASRLVCLDDDDDDEDENGNSDEDDSDDDQTDDDSQDSDDDADDQDSDDSDDEEEDDDESDVEALKKALAKERKARRKAERRAKRRNKSRSRDGDDDDEGSRGKRGNDSEDDESDDEPDQGTVKLRRANLITALTEDGFVGSRAKAVARLLDDVEFDEDDEPTNLKDAIEAAQDTYGKGLIRRGRKAPKTGGSGGGKNKETPQLSADELAYAKEFGMTPEEYAEFKRTNPTLPEQKT